MPIRGQKGYGEYMTFVEKIIRSFKNDWGAQRIAHPKITPEEFIWGNGRNNVGSDYIPTVQDCEELYVKAGIRCEYSSGEYCFYIDNFSKFFSTAIAG